MDLRVYAHQSAQRTGQEEERLNTVMQSGGKEAKRRPAPKRAKLKRSIIDCDIHRNTGMNVLKPYLTREYRELVEACGAALPGGMDFNGGVGGRMVDAFSAGRRGSRQQPVRAVQGADPAACGFVRPGSFRVRTGGEGEIVRCPWQLSWASCKREEPQGLDRRLEEETNKSAFAPAG